MAAGSGRRDLSGEYPRPVRPRRAVPVLALLLATSCGGGDTVTGPAPKAPELMRLRSPAFAAGGAIPSRFTCDGAGTSPPLTWTKPPAATREVALLMEDPDAPSGTFVHWTVYGLAPTTASIGEGAPPTGAEQGQNSFGKRGYSGPCPPKGDKPHRYVFSLYALRSTATLDNGAPPGDVRKAIAKAEPLARGRLIGTFKRG